METRLRECNNIFMKTSSVHPAMHNTTEADQRVWMQCGFEISENLVPQRRHLRLNARFHGRDKILSMQLDACLSPSIEKLAGPDRIRILLPVAIRQAFKKYVIGGQSPDDVFCPTYDGMSSQCELQNDGFPPMNMTSYLYI